MDIETDMVVDRQGRIGIKGDDGGGSYSDSTSIQHLLVLLHFTL